jgi:putative transposase
MDERSVWLDNIIVESFWYSVKDGVNLNTYNSVAEALNSIINYLELQNRFRPHSRLSREIPDKLCYNAANDQGSENIGRESTLKSRKNVHTN